VTDQDLTDYRRSASRHPAGKHRISGCLGERGHFADPRHNPPPPRPQSSDFEAVLAVLVVVAVVTFVVGILITQVWAAGLGLTGVALVALGVLIIHTLKEKK
jgi:multisubunit Na+/H+ antiporter MnhB subunit